MLLMLLQMRLGGLVFGVAFAGMVALWSLDPASCMHHAFYYHGIIPLEVRGSLHRQNPACMPACTPPSCAHARSQAPVNSHHPPKPLATLQPLPHPALQVMWAASSILGCFLFMPYSPRTQQAALTTAMQDFAWTEEALPWKLQVGGSRRGGCKSLGSGRPPACRTWLADVIMTLTCSSPHLPSSQRPSLPGPPAGPQRRLPRRAAGSPAHVLL
jgi:hypothetical protein